MRKKKGPAARRLGTLSARIREGDAFGEGRTTSCTILGTLSARIRESDTFGEEERLAAPFLGRFQHASEERVTPNGKEINNHTKGNPGGRSEIIFWNVRGCSRTIERRISVTTTPLRGRFLNQPYR